MHMLGQIIQIAGADHILWGTDSIWNGSPQSQIARRNEKRHVNRRFFEETWPTHKPLE
jgi:hypothetical protein